ncbi:MAG: hypothetical protein JWN42_169, partial [Candidatus Angelobacter sp.]|nr:hypothetical protein [Candidatus Angelobacter sp.]
IGLTFATVSQKLEVQSAGALGVQPAYQLSTETTLEHRLNVVFSALLALSVLGLWIYFR